MSIIKIIKYIRKDTVLDRAYLISFVVTLLGIFLWVLWGLRYLIAEFFYERQNFLFTLALGIFFMGIIGVFSISILVYIRVGKEEREAKGV